MSEKRIALNDIFTPEKPHTIEGIYALPDDQRFELIGGQMYMMTPPTPFHQEFILEFSVTIRPYIRNNHGEDIVYKPP